jgi:hypothetical protein
MQPTIMTTLELNHHKLLRSADLDRHLSFASETNGITAF